MQRCILVCVILWALLGHVSAARAVDYFWQNNTGGGFDEPSNYLPFIPPVTEGPGGPLDTVNFDLGATTPYLITDVAGENSRLIVHNDSVQLSIFPEYSLANTGGASPSLVVGAATGDVANLVLSGAPTSLLENDVTRIANAVGSTGSIIAVDLQWNNGNLRVGHFGEGALTIDESAAVTSTNASLGHLANSRGTARVEDGTWTISGELLIGREGDGSLTVSTGGTLTTLNATIGSEPTGDGSVLISNTNSNWIIQNTLNIGTAGDGDINIAGGDLTTTTAIVGGLPGSDGVVILNGGDWNATGQLTVGGQDVGPTVGGSGFVRIANGALISDDELLVNRNGRLEVDGGTLTANVVTVDAPTGQFAFTDGVLSVREFNGNLVNTAGSLHPYEDTAINGNYTQEPAGRVFHFISGEAVNHEYDSVTVTGTAALDGELYFLLENLYDPDPTEVYTLLTATTLLGAFDNITSGQRVDDLNNYGSFIVYYGPTSPFNPNHVVLASFLPGGPAGDYNSNGIVDAADYTVWRDHLGAPAGTLLNDVDGGTIDQDQYETWKQNFGTHGEAAVSTVPEPATIWMLLVACGAISIPRIPPFLKRSTPGLRHALARRAR